MTAPRNKQAASFQEAAQAASTSFQGEPQTPFTPLYFCFVKHCVK